MSTEEYDFNPFESPQAPASPVGARTKSKVKWARPFASGRVAAVVTIALLAIVMISDLIGSWCCFGHVWLLEHAASPATIQAHSRLMALMLGANALALLATGGAFVVWTYFVYRNLPALGALQPESTPVKAAGWYFVPVAWFAMPYVVMGEIWGQSDPAQIDKLRKKSSPLVKIWWALFLAWWVAWYLASFQAPDRFAVDATNFRNAALAIQFITGIAAILLVFQVDRNQQAKHDCIARQSRDA